MLLVNKGTAISKLACICGSGYLNYAVPLKPTKYSSPNVAKSFQLYGCDARPHKLFRFPSPSLSLN